MKRIASPRTKKPPTHGEAGFTLTELIVGLLVASALIVGLVELTKRYARTSGDVRQTVFDARASRVIAGLFSILERADPDSVVVTPSRIDARIGADEVRAQLQVSSGETTLAWHSSDIERTIEVPDKAKFEQSPNGLVRLMAPDAPAPIAMTTPRRDVPYDCQFDTVTLECRQ